MDQNIPAFQRFQRQFLANLRNPHRHGRPEGTPASGMKLYQRLLYNKIEDSLLACFPITHALLGKRRWTRLVKSFVAEHRCLSPYYGQIPDEFIDYLQAATLDPEHPPCLVELAHYEWIELVLAIEEGEPDSRTIAARGDLLTGQPAFAPVLRLLSYRYPVHRIAVPGKNHLRQWRQSPFEWETAAPPTFLLGFRAPDDEVHFIEINAATARLIELLREGGLTGQEALVELAAEIKHPEPLQFTAFGAEILDGLRNQSAILGVRHNRPIPINSQKTQ